MEEDNGAFADYVKMSADLTWKVPDAMTSEQAATMPVSLGSDTDL